MALLVLAWLAAAAPDAFLVARVSQAALPCTASAAEAYRSAGGEAVRIEAGGLRDDSPADVLVGFDVEMTRALESGAAVDGSEVDVARIPWVLGVDPSATRRPRSLSELEGVDEVWILGGPAAYEARRAVASHPPARLRETDAAADLQAAKVALVPLSLAGGRDVVAVDVPPLEARAAVAARSTRSERAAAFVRYLGSEAGQKAFAGCHAAR